MPTRQHVGIAGAGLLGRLMAWMLTQQGHAVTVFDPAPGPGPRFLSDSEAAGQCLQPAAFTAAGMLSPLAELDAAEPAVAALGWRSINLWQRITAQLPGQPSCQVRGSWLLAHRSDAGAAQRVLDRLRVATHSPDWTGQSPPAQPERITPEQLATLEPALQGPAHAWYLPGEAHIDAVATLNALHDAAQTVQWRWSNAVQQLDPEATLTLADGTTHRFDSVVDARGLGARSQCLVRGVRGEIVWLHAPGHGLTRPARLIHPRHRVYVVPRSHDTVLVGASEIESEDRSAVSLRSAVELMSAAHSVLPGLAEARIKRLDANLRPALPNNAPSAVWQGRRLQINGLFRHGWLLAPALALDALRRQGLVGAHFLTPLLSATEVPA